MNVNKKVVKKGLLPYVFLFLVMLGVIYFVSVANQKVNVLTYDEFMTSLEDKQVEEITVTPRERAQVYEIAGKLDNYKENESFFVRVPLSDQVMKKLVEASEVDDFEFTSVADPESSTILLVIVNVLPIALLAFICFWFLTKQMGGGKNSLDFGKSKAKIIKNKGNKHGRVILVTAINPTPYGEGKTTVSIGLADAFNKLNKSIGLALREPSLGPVFENKSGAAGG